MLEIMKALKVASEAGATINEYGVMTPARGPLDAARNYYPGVYHRMVEIMQLISSSGLIMIPTEDDFDGPMAADIRKYLGSAGGTSDDRVRLFRLAWDMTISGFGGRQSLYETLLLRRSGAHEAGALHGVRPQRVRRARAPVRRRQRPDPAAGQRSLIASAMPIDPDGLTQGRAVNLAQTMTASTTSAARARRRGRGT